jgi:AcrR family transcriptional regulator
VPAVDPESLTVPEKPIGLRERNRVRTRGEILAAMSLLLGDRPFESITIDDVSEAAGVSRGTIYTYFPEGRDQLLRDAYARVAASVVAAGSENRERHHGVTDRIVALAGALVDAATTPEGRFYARIGTATVGPLSGVTGRASTQFLEMLIEDLEHAKRSGALRDVAPVDELAVLISGAVREVGSVAAEEPTRAPRLLAALRSTCDVLLTAE